MTKMYHNIHMISKAHKELLSLTKDTSAFLVFYNNKDNMEYIWKSNKYFIYIYMGIVFLYRTGKQIQILASALKLRPQAKS